MDRVLIRVQLPEIYVNSVSDEYIKECNQKKTVFNKHKDVLTHYLNNAVYLSILLDLAKCIFEKKSISHNLTLCTDGNWIWSADLNHYSEEHNFIWPRDFIRSVEDRNYNNPVLSDVQLTLLTQIANDIKHKFMTESITNWVMGAPPKMPKISTYHVDELRGTIV